MEKFQLDEFRLAEQKRSCQNNRQHQYYLTFCAAVLFVMTIFLPSLSIYIGAGVLLAGLVLFMWQRVKLPRCPHCRKRLPETTGIFLAFRHCPFCDAELFDAPPTPAVWPGIRREPESWKKYAKRLLPPVLLVLSMIPLGLGLEWLRSKIGNQPGESLGIVLFLIAFSFAGTSFLSVPDLRFPSSYCPVCGEAVDPVLVENSGNCNCCGAALLETLPPKPDAVLPERNHILIYHTWTRRVVNGISLFLIIASVITHSHQLCWELLSLVAIFGILFWVLFVEIKMRRRYGLSANCPNCGHRIPKYLDLRYIATRCPSCARRLVEPSSE